MWHDGLTPAPFFWPQAWLVSRFACWAPWGHVCLPSQTCSSVCLAAPAPGVAFSCLSQTLLPRFPSTRGNKTSFLKLLVICFWIRTQVAFPVSLTRVEGVPAYTFLCRSLCWLWRTQPFAYGVQFATNWTVLNLRGRTHGHILNFLQAPQAAGCCPVPSSKLLLVFLEPLNCLGLTRWWWFHPILCPLLCFFF